MRCIVRNKAREDLSFNRRVPSRAQELLAVVLLRGCAVCIVLGNFSSTTMLYITDFTMAVEWYFPSCFYYCRVLFSLKVEGTFFLIPVAKGKIVRNYVTNF